MLTLAANPQKNPTEYRAKIPPVPEDIQRPMWSVMIPTYNCAQYLRKTLESVLAQDPGQERMQIEVVDDCSTEDDPQSVVDELGRGRVSFFRQSQNVGLVRNFETCLLRSKHGQPIPPPNPAFSLSRLIRCAVSLNLRQALFECRKWKVERHRSAFHRQRD